MDAMGWLATAQEALEGLEAGEHALRWGSGAVLIVGALYLLNLLTKVAWNLLGLREAWKGYRRVSRDEDRKARDRAKAEFRDILEEWDAQEGARSALYVGSRRVQLRELKRLVAEHPETLLRGAQEGVKRELEREVRRSGQRLKRGRKEPDGWQVTPWEVGEETSWEDDLRATLLEWESKARTTRGWGQ